jgi:hypothetical protein
MSLFSVTFESGSRLSRIENEAFLGTGLVETILSASVEFLGCACFSACRSLTLGTFEPGWKLQGNEKEVIRQNEVDFDFDEDYKIWMEFADGYLSYRVFGCGMCISELIESNS